MHLLASAALLDLFACFGMQPFHNETKNENENDSVVLVFKGNAIGGTKSTPPYTFIAISPVNRKVKFPWTSKNIHADDFRAGANAMDLLKQLFLNMEPQSYSN